MTVETALAELERHKLYVSWLCQGTDGLWICTVRNAADMPFSVTRGRAEYVRRGKGKTLQEAIVDATPSDEFEELI